MAPIIAPGIVRYAASGPLSDRTWVNVLDCHVTGAPGDRGDAVHEQAERIFDAYYGLRTVLSSAWGIREVRYVDLDDANGRVGFVTRGNTATGLTMGAVASPAPPNVAALVKKVTSGRRGSRAGRLYLPGLAESQINGPNLEPSALADLNTAFNAFQTAITVGDWGPEIITASTRAVVVHTQAGQFVGESDISDFAVQQRLATQRRRLRGT